MAVDRDVDLKSLRSFCMVNKYGSLDRAAAHLKVTPAAVSVRLKTLEQQLGGRIFDHRPNRLVLTKKGHILLTETTNVLNALAKLQDAVGHEPDVYAGKLTITLGRDLGALFAGKIATFIKDYPRLRVTLLSKSSAEAISLILAGDVDVGISRLPKVPPGLHRTMLIDSRLYLIFPARHPLARQRKITLADIAQSRLILHAAGQVTRRRIDSVFAKHGIAIENFLEVTTCEAVTNYVQLGVGIGFVHDICLPVRREKAIRAVEMTGEFGTMDVSLMYKTSAPLTPACRALIDALAAPRVEKK